MAGLFRAVSLMFSWSEWPQIRSIHHKHNLLSEARDGFAVGGREISRDRAKSNTYPCSPFTHISHLRCQRARPCVSRTRIPHIAARSSLRTQRCTPSAASNSKAPTMTVHQRVQHGTASDTRDAADSRGDSGLLLSDPNAAAQWRRSWMP